MIQMTLIQIDNYGPWTVTPRPRNESDLQILQAELYADLERQFANKKGLVFFTRFDNLLAVTNGIDEEDHLRIQRYLLEIDIQLLLVWVLGRLKLLMKLKN